MNPDSLPVPKVYAATLGTLIVSSIITIFIRFGWTYDQAAAITPAVIDAIYILGPPIATFIFGYFKTDGDRSRLIKERDYAAQEVEDLTNAYLARIEDLENKMQQYRKDAAVADKTLRNYLSHINRPDA